MSDLITYAALLVGLVAWIAIFGGIVHVVRSFFRRRDHS